MIGEMANMNNNPKSGTTSINISEPEISAYTKNLFMVSNQQIVGKTNPFNGERAFVLCSLEQLIGLLSFTTINDQMIIQHTKNLVYVLLMEYTNTNFLNLVMFPLSK